MFVNTRTFCFDTKLLYCNTIFNISALFLNSIFYFLSKSLFVFFENTLHFPFYCGLKRLILVISVFQLFACRSCYSSNNLVHVFTYQLSFKWFPDHWGACLQSRLLTASRWLMFLQLGESFVLLRPNIFPKHLGLIKR